MVPIPKLDRATAVKVNKAEGAGGKLVPEDTYKLKLKGCKVSPKPDKNGNKYWIWAFEIDEGEYKGTGLSVNTGLAENQHWFLKLVFDAFEAKPNADTEDLVGKVVLGVVDQGEITGGPRKGQTRNNITSLMPLSGAAGDDDEDFSEEAAEGEDGEDPDF